MELFRYEILHTETGRATAEKIRALIADDPMLGAGSEPRDGGELPSSNELFAMVVVVTDDVAREPDLCARVRAADAAGFPIIPVVPDVSTYDFRRAPLPQLSARNAVGLSSPRALVDTLLHHGGLRRHGTGGQVFISYARDDGTLLADDLRDGLQDAGFRCFVDRVELEGGISIQPRIQREIGLSDMVILIDSVGAKRSVWVQLEMDFARAAHVPVIAVAPTEGAFHHDFRTPHIAWDKGEDTSVIAAKAVAMARRHLARKDSFRERVARVLQRVTMLRGWALNEDYPPWLVCNELLVDALEEQPSGEQVIGFAEQVGKRRGMLVGGTRPYPRLTRVLYENVGGASDVCVTPLSQVASKIPVRLGPHGLSGQRIFLSAAAPDPEEQDAASLTLAPFVVILVQTLTDLGATVVFGGHPAVTPLVHRALADLPNDGGGGIELHQAQFWEDQEQTPAVVNDRKIFKHVVWHGDGAAIPSDLEALRAGMIGPDLDGGVFIGGKDKKSRTNPPGIVAEYRRFRAQCPDKPAFVVGMAFGAARHRLPTDDQPPHETVDRRLCTVLRETPDPDLAVALIVSELLDRCSAKG